MDDAAIRELLGRLSRPHASGGDVVERAAILAAGADLASVVEWIDEHSGRPEAMPATQRRGLHGAHVADAAGRAPVRYVLPAGTLG